MAVSPSCERKSSSPPKPSWYPSPGSKVARSKVEARVRPVVRSSGRSPLSLRTTRDESPSSPASSRSSETVAPISRVRLLL